MIRILIKQPVWWNITRGLITAQVSSKGCVVFCFAVLLHPGRKKNMEPKNGGLEDDFPFQLDDF